MFGRALERDRQFGLLHGAQEGLDSAGIQFHEILEDEHQGLDLFSRIAVALLERGQEPALRVAIEIVEDFGHHLEGIAPVGTGKIAHELGPQGLLDTVENLLLHHFHVQHANDHFHGEGFRKDAQHHRGMIRLDLGQHHGDGLGIFVLEVIRQDLLTHVAELVPHGASGRPPDLLHDVVDPFLADRLEQEPLRALVGADQRAARRDLLDELTEQPLHGVGANVPEAGHMLGNLLDFLIVHQRENTGRLLLVQGQHHDGRLLGAVQVSEILFNGHTNLRLTSRFD